MSLVISTISLGLLWSVLTLGVYITFRVLNIADLSVEGTFPLGAAVAAALIDKGAGPMTAVAAAMAAGMAGGALTGLMHTKLKIPALLAGILSMIGLYSVNLRVMGKANISLLGMDTVYSWMEKTGMGKEMAVLAVGVVAVGVVAVAMYWFFGTEKGMSIRATGQNPQMIRAQGVNTHHTILLGLILGNGLVAISGALIAQNNGFADVGMGIGTIVIGLASVIIGEVLFGARSFKNSLVSIILGSIVYRAVIATVLKMGMSPNDLKLLTAVLVAFALSLPLIKEKWAAMRGGKNHVTH
ncbi:MAG: ABC transporter permease [Eubacteriales bacterium]|jgi:putative ABC transport system permease protein